MQLTTILFRRFNSRDEDHHAGDDDDVDGRSHPAGVGSMAQKTAATSVCVAILAAMFYYIIISF